MTTPPRTRPHVVPHIVPRSREQDDPRPLVSGPTGLAYQPERPGDRDTLGVLWAGIEHHREGVPEWAAAHPHRQRLAAVKSRCQVRNELASRTAEGTLFLLDGCVPPERWEGLLTAHPPLCLRCVPDALTLCPVLQEGYTAVRAQEVSYDDVHGDLYQRGPGGLAFLVKRKQWVPVNDQNRIAWTLARQQGIRLRHVVKADLARELAPLGLSLPGS